MQDQRRQRRRENRPTFNRRRIKDPFNYRKMTLDKHESKHTALVIAGTNGSFFSTLLFQRLLTRRYKTPKKFF